MNLNLNLKFWMLGGLVGALATGALSSWFFRDWRPIEYLGDASKAENLYCHRRDDGSLECAEFGKFLRFLAGQDEAPGENAL